MTDSRHSVSFTNRLGTTGRGMYRPMWSGRAKAGRICRSALAGRGRYCETLESRLESIGNRTMTSLNPYAPPTADARVTSAISSHLLTVHRIYWWIGSVGTFSCLCAALVGIVVFSREGTASVAPIALTTCLHGCFFNYCRIIGNRLFSRPERYRIRSRIVGFALAVFYFPILTFPGLYCVWKIDKHFELTGTNAFAEESRNCPA